MKGLKFKEMIQKNLRTKYVYSEYQGYYVAKLVNQMSLSQRVMVAGHSYGGIITSSALHYLGGGCLRGLTLAGGQAVERPNLRGGVVSGAFDNDALIPGYRYGQAFVAAEKIYVTRNIKDSTLKNWHKVSFRCQTRHRQNGHQRPPFGTIPPQTVPANDDRGRRQVALPEPTPQERAVRTGTLLPVVPVLPTVSAQQRAVGHDLAGHICR